MISPAVADLVALLLRAYARQGFAVILQLLVLIRCASQTMKR